MKKVTISSTMGPGVSVETNSAMGAEQAEAAE
jgi:hypothetical protein